MGLEFIALCTSSFAEVMAAEEITLVSDPRGSGNPFMGLKYCLMLLDMLKS